MATLICPDCKGTVSERATSCPHCGCPSEYFESQESIDSRGDSKQNIPAAKTKEKHTPSKCMETILKEMESVQNRDFSKGSQLYNQVLYEFTLLETEFDAREFLKLLEKNNIGDFKYSDKNFDEIITNAINFNHIFYIAPNLNELESNTRNYLKWPLTFKIAQHSISVTSSMQKAAVFANMRNEIVKQTVEKYKEGIYKNENKIEFDQ